MELTIEQALEAAAKNKLMLQLQEEDGTYYCCASVGDKKKRAVRVLAVEQGTTAAGAVIGAVRKSELRMTPLTLVPTQADNDE